MRIPVGRFTVLRGLALGSYADTPAGGLLRLDEKLGLQHELPCHPFLDRALQSHILAAGIKDPLAPPFQPVRGHSQTLLGTTMDLNDIFRMIRRRTARAGLPPLYGSLTRPTGIMLYLDNGGTLEKAREIAGHSSNDTTTLYDRRRRRGLAQKSNSLSL